VQTVELIYSHMIVVTVSQERTYIMEPQSTLNCQQISLGDHLVALLWLLLLNLSTLLSVC